MGWVGLGKCHTEEFCHTGEKIVDNRHAYCIVINMNFQTHCHWWIECHRGLYVHMDCVIPWIGSLRAHPTQTPYSQQCPVRFSG